MMPDGQAALALAALAFMAGVAFGNCAGETVHVRAACGECTPAERGDSCGEFTCTTGGWDR